MRAAAVPVSSLRGFFFYEEKGMCSCVHMNKYIQESRTVYATSLRAHIFFSLCVGVCVCAYVYVSYVSIRQHADKKPEALNDQGVCA